jgi:hypothetical protein
MKPFRVAAIVAVFVLGACEVIGMSPDSRVVLGQRQYAGVTVKGEHVMVHARKIGRLVGNNDPKRPTARWAVDENGNEVIVDRKTVYEISYDGGGTWVAANRLENGMFVPVVTGAQIQTWGE